MRRAFMMKTTRHAFCFKGDSETNKEIVSQIVSGFKAISRVENITPENVNKVFKCNKNIITMNPNIAKITDTIFIGVNDSLQRFNIHTKCSNEEIQEQFKEIAENCNVDIGDHRSHSTKEGPSQKPQDCVFCRYLLGHPDHYQPSMYESENFVMMANTGHFVPGSLLIIPKKHIMSCAELNEKELNELLEVIADCKYLLRKLYGMDTLLWENSSGSGGHGKDKSSIVHAHIHMNPCDMEVLKVSAQKGITPQKIEYHDLPKYQENSYLLIQNYDLQWYIVSNPELYIPRQYVRQLVAEHVNLPGDLWNWRKYMFLDEVAKTTNEIKNYLISHKKDLPTRILERTSHFV